MSREKAINLVTDIVKDYNIRHDDCLDPNPIANAFGQIHNIRLTEERDLLIEFSGFLMGRGDLAMLNILYVQDLIMERAK